MSYQEPEFYPPYPGDCHLPMLYVPGTPAYERQLDMAFGPMWNLISEQQKNRQNKIVFDSVQSILDPLLQTHYQTLTHRFTTHLEPTLRIFLMKKEK